MPKNASNTSNTSINNASSDVATPKQKLSSHCLEEGTVAGIDFTKIAQIGRDGHQVVPVVLQDVISGEVLFIGYANEEALRLTLERRSAVLYSTSRNQIWHKGATSGDTLSLVDVRVNCEQNSLLYRVRRDGQGACHTRDASGVSRPNCYYRTVEDMKQLRHLVDRN